MRPIGTIKTADQEGALVLDLAAGLYMLIDRTGAVFELYQPKVQAALRS